jgi:hypothetical protein
MRQGRTGLPTGLISVSFKVTPNIARDYFSNKKNQTIEIISLSEVLSLPRICGLSEVIVDIVESAVKHLKKIPSKCWRKYAKYPRVLLLTG